MNRILKEQMKAIAIFTFVGSLISNLTYAQVKVATGGIVGMGGEPEMPKRLVVSGDTKFFWPGNDPLQIATHVSNPRIQSLNKVVFYNIANTGFINVELGTLYEYSDVIAKENIQSLNIESESPLSKIKKLNGVSYQWKDSKVKNRQTGFIAQDVEKIMPELVSTNDSTGGKMMSYTHMIPYLVEAIKEQQDVIEKLKEEVTRLTFPKVGVKEEEVAPVKQKVGQ